MTAQWCPGRWLVGGVAPDARRRAGTGWVVSERGSWQEAFGILAERATRILYILDHRLTKTDRFFNRVLPGEYVEAQLERDFGRSREMVADLYDWLGRVREPADLLASEYPKFTGDRDSGTRSEWLRLLNQLRGRISQYETAVLSIAPQNLSYGHCVELYYALRLADIEKGIAKL